MTRNPEIESREPRKNSEDRPFIVKDGVFSAVNFEERVKAYFRLTRNGPEIIGFEELVTDEERKAEAERIFLEAIGPLIEARLELRAAKSAPGAETINSEMLVNELTAQFDTGARTLYGLHAEENELEDVIAEQGKQITRGETRMGTTPGLVRTEITRLTSRARRLKPKPPESR